MNGVAKMNSMFIVRDENYLIHWGIKGQKWGIRRYENYDGSLTPEGERRYGLRNTDGNLKIGRSAKAFYRETKNNEKRYAKELEAEKVNNTKLSKRREKLIAMYKEKGLSQEDAELAAIKRDKIEKTLKIAGAITVAAAAAYGTYKVHQVIQNNADVVIPKGTDIFRTTGDSSEELNRAGFVAIDAKDAIKYKGIYAKQIQYQKAMEARNNIGFFGARKQVDPNVYQLNAKARDEIKVAGEKKGKQIYEKLMRTDPEFKSDTQMVKSGWEGSYGAVPGDSYRAFNQRLVDHSTPQAERMQKKFYDALKREGYGGVIDTNDRHNSGYDTKKPVILFNMKDSFTDLKSKTLSPKDIESSSKKAYDMIYRSRLSKRAVSALGVGSIIAGSQAVNSVNNIRIHELTTSRKAASQRFVIQNYKRLHPGTKLTDKQILENELGPKNQ